MDFNNKDELAKELLKVSSVIPRKPKGELFENVFCLKYSLFNSLVGFRLKCFPC